jgi:hypothetical protein
MGDYTREDCEKFTNENLAELAGEILEWKNTCILRNGKMRVLSDMVNCWADSYHDLQIAESMVNHAALVAVSTLHISDKELQEADNG